MPCAEAYSFARTGSLAATARTWEAHIARWAMAVAPISPSSSGGIRRPSRNQARRADLGHQPLPPFGQLVRRAEQSDVHATTRRRERAATQHAHSWFGATPI